MKSWKLSAYAPKAQVQAALLAHDEIDDWDIDLVISGREMSEDRPLDWVLEAWYPTKPDAEQKSALARLFEGEAPQISVEKLPDLDWLTLSQQGTKPIAAGPFYVHTRDFPPKPGAVNFTIPAAQAFGTGHHETTAGCLETLAQMKSKGCEARRIADIGTGTGLLGFAAMHLWPGAETTATDIDPVCVDVVEENAALNGIDMGGKPGEMTMVVADGMDHPLIKFRAPFDLLIANILAGPLVELAEDFAEAVSPRGDLLLAGLLAGEQEEAVRRAYKRAGFAQRGRLQRGDWAILWMRRRLSWRIPGRTRARINRLG